MAGQKKEKIKGNTPQGVPTMPDNYIVPIVYVDENGQEIKSTSLTYGEYLKIRLDFIEVGVANSKGWFIKLYPLTASV